jgi:hypothetical protein
VLQERTLRRLAYHHHRIGAIDGDDLDDAPRHGCFQSARKMRYGFQTLRPGPPLPNGMVSSLVEDGRHQIGP